MLSRRYTIEEYDRTIVGSMSSSSAGCDNNEIPETGAATATVATTTSIQSLGCASVSYEMRIITPTPTKSSTIDTTTTTTSTTIIHPPSNRTHTNVDGKENEKQEDTAVVVIINKLLDITIKRSWDNNNLTSSPIPTSLRSYLTNNIYNWMKVAWTQCLLVCSELFLPVDYPDSVRSGYWYYQYYDAIQGLCSYLRTVWCHAAFLEATGILGFSKIDTDDSNSSDVIATTAWSMAMVWTFRDGMAMIGGLLYSYCACRSMDGHVKEFRLWADIVNDIGYTLDMFTPYMAYHLSSMGVLMITSASGLCKTICGISAGATKGSITAHYALQNNIADLNAKEGTQETLVSLIGMVLGIVIGRQMQYYQGIQNHNQDQQSTTINNNNNNNPSYYHILNWTMFVLLTTIHIWANWKAVNLLRMRTLNRVRAEIVFHNLIQQIVHQLDPMDASNPSNKTNVHHSLNTTTVPTIIQNIIHQLPSPEDVHESIFRSAFYILFSDRLKLGVPLIQVLPHMNASRIDCDALVANSQKNKYVVVSSQTNHRPILVTLMVGATPMDELRAYLHGSVLLSFPNPSALIDYDTNITNILDLLFDESTNLLQSTLQQKGWDVERFYLGFSRKRSRFTYTATTTQQDALPPVVASKKEN